MSDSKKAADQLIRVVEALFLNENKKFTAAMLSPRFKATADKLRQDLTINQVAFVIEKMAEKDPFKEITSQDLKFLAGKFYTSTTKFANEFSDLLEDAPEVAQKQTSRLDAQGGARDIAFDGAHEKTATNIYDETASASLVDKNLSYTEEDLNLIRHAAMLIDEELKGTGKVNKVSSVLKHRTADSLIFQTTIRTSSNETNVFIPVEVKNEVPLFPQVMSTTEKVYTLDSTGIESLTADINYSTNLKRANHATSLRSAEDYEVALRNDSMGKYDQEVDELDVEAPKQLSLGHDEIERVLKEAILRKDSKHNKEAQDYGRDLVELELKEMGFKNPQVTFNGDYEAGLTYAATVNTEVGKFNIEVPVENRKGTLLTPYQFSTAGKVYEFSKQAVMQAAKIYKTTSPEIHPFLYSMSYPDLKKQLKTAATEKKYKLAQQIISLIDEKFGEHYRNAATDDFQTWLEESLTSYASRCGDCDYYVPKTLQANNDFCNLVKTAAKNVQRDVEASICTRSTYAGSEEKVFFDAGSDIKITWED